MNYVIMSVGNERLERFKTTESRLFTASYGPEYDMFAPFASVHLYPTGQGKWRNISRLMTQLPGEFGPDDYFWFPDPDLQFEPGTIEKLFSFAREYQLDLCQPAIEGYTAHEHLRRNGEWMHDVPFVEVMCPMFSAAALARNFWTFGLSYSGYGLDLMWGEKERCRVVDSVVVTHPTPCQFDGVKYGLQRPMMDIERLRTLGFLPKETHE